MASMDSSVSRRARRVFGGEFRAGAVRLVHGGSENVTGPAGSARCAARGSSRRRPFYTTEKSEGRHWSAGRVGCRLVVDVEAPRVAAADERHSGRRSPRRHARSAWALLKCATRCVPLQQLSPGPGHVLPGSIAPARTPLRCGSSGIRAGVRALSMGAGLPCGSSWPLCFSGLRLARARAWTLAGRRRVA